MCCHRPSVPYASRVCSQALVIISRRRGPYGEKAGACMMQPATRSGYFSVKSRATKQEIELPSRYVRSICRWSSRQRRSSTRWSQRSGAEPALEPPWLRRSQATIRLRWASWVLKPRQIWASR
jgi:hypothetical protein